jgi:hypothetical protein
MPVESDIKIYPVDSVSMHIVFVIRQFIPDPEHNYYKTGHPYCETQDVQQCECFAPKGIPDEKLEK